jgi:hypothetical protein
MLPADGSRRLTHQGSAPPLIQRQLGHSHLSTTGTYLQGINTEEIISTVHAPRLAATVAFLLCGRMVSSRAKRGACQSRYRRHAPTLG